MSTPWRRRALALAFAAGAAAVQPAIAADPVGIWLTEGGKSRVRVADCGGGLCGTLVWLKEPNDPDTGRPKADKNNVDTGKRGRPLIGLTIVLGMKPSGTPDKWNGQVYNPEDGKTYSGSLTLLGPAAVRLEGCALGGLVCKGQNWSRIN